MLEWGLAAQWANYTQEAFFALPGWRQNYVIGLYRTHHRMEAVVADHQRKEMERKSKHRAGGGRRHR